MESVGHLDVAVVTKAYPSRSAHFRSADGGHALRSKPVTATRFEPEERNYQ
jgi:hypothetical protein